MRSASAKDVPPNFNTTRPMIVNRRKLMNYKGIDNPGVATRGIG